MWNLTKIPKIAHFYWGSNHLSYLRYLTLATFRKQNPDWVIKFYYPKKVYTGGPVWNQGFAEGVTGIDYTTRAATVKDIQMIELDFDTMGIGYIPDVFRSDILRLKLLGSEGGFWGDMDILFFKPMDSMCFNTPGNNIDTVISYSTEKRHYSIGFLFSSVNNSFYNFLYQHSLKNKNRDGEYQHLGIKLWSMHFPNIVHLINKYPQLKIYNIDLWLSYSLNSFEINKILDMNTPFNDPRTIALHWYGGHPRCVEWETKLTPDNLNQFNNTLINTIKRALQ